MTNLDPDTTPRLQLPYIMPSQAQKHVTHNEAISKLDRLAQLSVRDRDLSAPPIGAADGDCFIVGPAASALWTGHSGEIAVAEGEFWWFLAPSQGLHAFVEDEQVFVFYDGTVWRETAETLTALSLEALAINTSTNPVAKLAAETDSVFFSHDAATPGSGDIRAYLNKAASSKTASILFQTNFSGRAEIGTAGTDEFQMKVSPDGSTWKTAIRLESAGAVHIPEKLNVGSAVASTGVLTVATATPSMTLRDTDSTGNQHIGYLNWVDGAGVQKAWLGLGSSSSSDFMILSQYSDGIALHTFGGNYPIQLNQNGNVRLKVHTNGNVGVHEAAPTAPLHVGGAVRVGTYTAATLPSAAVSGAGSIVYVSNESGGATLAFSDGTNWRRAHDRAVVS